MTEKTIQEQAAAERQKKLLSDALAAAKGDDGYWLNAKGRALPRFLDKPTTVSAFNALILGLHTGAKGFQVAQYTTFNEAVKRGDAVLQGEKGVPFYWYRWDKYVHRHNPEEVISKEDYQALPPDKQGLYKGVRTREVRTLFNVEQTTLPMKDAERFRALTERYGTREERGNVKSEERQLHSTVNQFAAQMRQFMLPIRKEASCAAHYDTDKDAVYLPDQKHFAHYEAYVQELMRQVVSATGHQQRLAREGMVMQHGKAPSEEAVKYEALVSELASGVKMMELGLPAQIAPEHRAYIDDWREALEKNPNLLDALESDLNGAIEVIRHAEQGEKMEYASVRNKYQTEAMQQQASETEGKAEGETVREAPEFERVQMLRDDEDHWTLYLKPAQEAGFSIRPDKEDLNRFFSTMKQGDKQSAAGLRQELAAKYYALAQKEGTLKVDLFGGADPTLDLSRIERVNLYKTPDAESERSHYMCAVRIRGCESVAPREITPQQWQRVWVAEDAKAYKTNLAAKVFADVLREERREEAVDEHFETQLRRVDELKAKHPDSVVLMRRGDSYEAFRGDAERVSEVCKLAQRKQSLPGSEEKVPVVSFLASALDSYLPKLIRAQMRVAICDEVEAPRREVAHHEEERRSGMRR